MNLRDLEYVHAVGVHLSFSKAALACNVSQPALSNQIKKLEQELGAALFDRGSQEVRPTELGRKVISAAEVVMNETQKIRDMATQYREPTAIPFKIGMTPTLAPYLTQYLGGKLRSMFPSMKVTLVETTPDKLAALVENRELDIAIIPRKCHDSNLDFSSLFDEPIFLAVKTGHRLAQKTHVSWADVSEGSYIRLEVPFGFEAEELAEPIMRSLSQNSAFDVTGVRFETVCRHICVSESSTIVPALAAEQFRKDGWQLSFIRFKDDGYLRKLGTISHPKSPRKKLVQHIIDEIIKEPPRGVRVVRREQGSSELNRMPMN